MKKMCSAYVVGAKYIVIFNYPYTNDTYGIMGDEHFAALEKFWNEVAQNKIMKCNSAEAALVLRKNCGYGLRYPEDKIWGFWGPDEKSSIIWEMIQGLLSHYGYSLDIVYDDCCLTFLNSYKTVYSGIQPLPKSYPLATGRIVI